MKKIFSLMLVLAAMFAFTACDNTADMSDEELANVIKEQQLYGGTDTDGDYWTLVVKETKAWFFIGEKRKDPDALMVVEGSWHVSEGMLYIEDEVLTISKNGKQLDYVDPEDPTFKVTLKDRSKTGVDIDALIEE